MATLRFGGFALDLETRQLTRAGVEVHLSPKAFALLTTLVTERPRALTKAELLQRVWPRTFVNEANLSNLVSELRSAFDEDSRKPRFVRTVHGFGYAFVASVTPTPAAGVRHVHNRSWIEWNGERVALAAGENVIGRDDGAAIQLDHSTVSRRHARIVVEPDGTLLEDCGSKNGTFRGTDRVTAPIRLDDGDVIRVGSVVLSYHAERRGRTTVTQFETGS